MKILLWNLFLMFVWAAETGVFTLSNLMVGFGLGFAILALGQRVFGRSSYFHKSTQIIGFAIFFLWELVLANLRVAYDVVTPTHYMSPGVVAVPLDARTDVEITLLANFVSLTPGTLSLDVSPDRRTLYVHAMYVTDADAVRSKIKSGFERRLLELLR